MESDKRISVIMGIRNCGDTLREALDSIVNQTYSNWEIVICDDASTDDSFIIANEYARKYKGKIIVLHNTENMYLAYSLNRCLAVASGYYIARMDGDDISALDRFEKQVGYLQTHEEVQLVGTYMRQFNSSEGYLQLVKKPIHPDKWSMRKTVPFNHATILTYKKVYDTLNGYTVAKRTRRGQDYDLWFRFLKCGYCGENIPEPLYYVREDMNSIKRRSFLSRWITFPTTVYGFKLLNYPKWWICEEFITRLVKSLVPMQIQYLNRRFRK